jgi:hypothetical protein
MYSDFAQSSLRYYGLYLQELEFAAPPQRYLCTWRRGSRAPSLNSLSFGDRVFLRNVSSSLGDTQGVVPVMMFMWRDGKDTRIDRFGLVQAGILWSLAK